jgi:hypothetical protein
MEQVTVVKIVLSATGVGQKTLRVYISLKFLKLTESFSYLLRRALVFALCHII